MPEITMYPLSKLSPNDTRMELSCGCTKMILIYFQSLYGKDKMAELICDTRMNLGYLQDRKNWISFEYYCRLLNELVRYTGNPDAPYEAGVFASKPECFGPAEILAARLTSMPLIYKLMVQMQKRWSRINEWKISNLTRSSCTISIRNYVWPQDKNNCLSLQGVLSSPPQVKNLPVAKVKEIKCACDGGDTCEYEITWVDKPSQMRGPVGFTVGLAGGVMAGYLFGWHILTYGTALMSSMLGYAVGWNRDCSRRMDEIQANNERQALSLHESMKDIEMLNEQLQQQVEIRTRELTKALKELEASKQRIVIAEKQSAIGVLAAGMAHEINNPLNAVRLSLQALKEENNDNAPAVSKILDRAERSAGRCARIVNELLASTREPRIEFNVRIEKILDVALILFKKDHDKNVKIRKKIATDIPTLTLDRMQIQQAITNIAKNALDAMDGKGIIDVSLGVRDDHVELAIADHGCGMDEYTMSKVFDPFFTTKKAGEGMGLGLAITYQLIQRNGGLIDVTSEMGKGTTFTIIFPCKKE